MLSAEENSSTAYRIAKLQKPIDLSSGWKSWEEIQPDTIIVDKYMGGEPKHKPDVKAKVAYDDEAFYVIFHVKDQYVRAVAESHQGNVWEDSCVEFFFTPNEDTKKGYFNVEMNCGGTVLFHFQRIPRSPDRFVLTDDDLSSVGIFHSLPKIVDPEIRDPTEWTVAYRIPFDLIKNRFPDEFVAARKGTIWRANFYKCADSSSHPHWLTWSRVDRSQPDFHRPEYFGSIIFE